MKEISPEGQMYAASLTQMREHLEEHHCEDCMAHYETMLRATLAYVTWQRGPDTDNKLTVSKERGGNLGGVTLFGAKQK